MAIHRIALPFVGYRPLRFGTYSGGSNPEEDEKLLEQNPEGFKRAVDAWADEQVKKAHEEGVKKIYEKVIELKTEEIRRQSELN